MLLAGQKLSGKVIEAQQGLAEAQAAQAEVAGQLARAEQELSALKPSTQKSSGWNGHTVLYQSQAASGDVPTATGAAHPFDR